MNLGANLLAVLFAIPAMLFTLYAQFRVQRTYSKYATVRNRLNVTGADVARKLMSDHNLNIGVETIKGNLTDHYDPRKDVMRLSQGVASTPSVAALGIVAHELGHAAQDQSGYALLKLRAGIVPFVQVGSAIGYIIFALGLMLNFAGLTWLGVILFSAGALFALVTLPVELDASKRAMNMLESSRLVSTEEEGQVRTVLNAAAMTYVAALAQAFSQLLYFVLMALGMGRTTRRRY
jgi:Zn-dependent membrane protease YugP